MIAKSWFCTCFVLRQAHSPFPQADSWDNGGRSKNIGVQGAEGGIPGPLFGDFGGLRAEKRERQGANVSLSWNGGIAPYQVQMATNLANPNWQNLGAPVNAGSLLVSPSNDAAFYRVFGQ